MALDQGTGLLIRSRDQIPLSILAGLLAIVFGYPKLTPPFPPRFVNSQLVCLETVIICRKQFEINLLRESNKETAK